MNRELFYLSLVTFLIVLTWIAFDVYHAFTETTVTEVQKELTTPLTSQFDHETILKVLERGLPTK